MLHIEKGAAQEAAVRFAEPEADPQTGFPIGRDHTDKSRNPHPEQGAGASGSKCSSNTGNISCSNGSSQGRAYRLELLMVSGESSSGVLSFVALFFYPG